MYLNMLAFYMTICTVCFVVICILAVVIFFLILIYNSTIDMLFAFSKNGIENIQVDKFLFLYQF